MKTINVVAAIIMREGQFLCTQKGFNKYDYISHKYEFPGGKIEAGETEENALVREIKEELEMTLVGVEKYVTVEHEYPDFNIVLHSYICNVGNEKIHLNEHLECKWLDACELLDLDWAAADIPIVNQLIADFI